MVMMIASPTTTSAAATTMTKNAAIWPSRLPWTRAKVTSARFEALSISSTHMNTTIALRRVGTPTQPFVDNRADRTRDGGGLIPGPPGGGGGAGGPGGRARGQLLAG